MDLIYLAVIALFCGLIALMAVGCAKLGGRK